MKIDETRGFTIDELRLKALATLKELGVRVPTEKQIKDFVENLKSLIKDEKLGIVMEEESPVKNNIVIMKHIHTFESFLNESNRTKRGNNKINFLKDSTSEVDHTRLVKWMGKNIDSNKYYFEKSKTVGYWILDVEKLSEGELKDLLRYLESEKYKFGTQIWLPAYESEINEGRDDRGAMEFNKSMLDMEDEVKKHSKPNWKKFEKSSGEFWKELNVESWADAFEKDSASCMSFKEELESYLR